VDTFDENPRSGFALLGLTPTSTEATPQPTALLSRREARAQQSGRTPAEPQRPVASTSRSAISGERRAKPSGKQKRAAREFARAARSHSKPLGRDRRTKRGSSAGSKAFSLFAMIFAGALLVGMSVPANAFMTASAPTGAVSAVERPGQTFEVSSEALEAAPSRDSFDAVSYAEVLALKYAGIDYSYNVTSGAVRWPFPYAVPITDGFGERSGGFHKGVDFVPGGGVPIYAIADGVAATSTYDNSGYGQHVIITHNLGGVNVSSLYAHMIEGSSPIVAGQEIKVGDFLGLVGETGIAYGAHLHFEVHIDGVPVDPFAWLQANAVN
jgi:murein DD-endopeptidase MepM/ murein hydrolase activator NlpD